MKRSKLSLIAMILGILAAFFMLVILAGMDTSGSSAESLGTYIGLAIVLPSVLTLGIAVILNIIGYFINNRVITLISAIFYVISLVLMPLWGFVGIPSMILQFIAFAKMKPKEPKIVYVEKIIEKSDDLNENN